MEASYTIKAVLQPYCGSSIRGSCITCYSVGTPSTIATLVRQRKTITCVCWYHVAGVLTQASRQMVIQINNSGQAAFEKEGSTF